MAGINLMNYSILQSELDQETTSLEDMHMFFVAFNQRQNKIIQQIEKAEMVSLANDRSNLLFIEDDSSNVNGIESQGKSSKPNDKSSNSRSSNRAQTKDRPASKDKLSKQPMNVILLKKEVDLEWITEFLTSLFSIWTNWASLTLDYKITWTNSKVVQIESRSFQNYYLNCSFIFFKYRMISWFNLQNNQSKVILH